MAFSVFRVWGSGGVAGTIDRLVTLVHHVFSLWMYSGIACNKLSYAFVLLPLNRWLTVAWRVTG
jgi:hypothetical protein